MPAGNPLLGSMVAPQVTEGYAKGITSDADAWGDDAKSAAASDSACSFKVAIVLGAAVFFVVMLRRGGFRDMVTV